MNKASQKISVLIIGGGISGLHTAYELYKHGIDFRLVEARDRLGGRILSRVSGKTGAAKPSAAFDLGPSWFWPHQFRIQSLINDLELTQAVFEQTEIGNSLFENQAGRIHQGISGASMRGSYRIIGGIQKITNGIIRKLPTSAVDTQTIVKEITYKHPLLTTRVDANTEIKEFCSDFVVLALPPRLVAESIKFKPQLTPLRIKQSKSTATWMAGQAKVAILYHQPFWHEQGFSGDVISELGPLQEIHDASSPGCKPYGLIGFIGIRAIDRIGKQDELRLAIVAQLTRLFGESAASPIEIYIKDWAFDPYTSTIEDQQQLLLHPSSTLDETIETSWDGRLLWSGTETAGMGEGHNGYLEGALEASERTVDAFTNRLGAKYSSLK